MVLWCKNPIYEISNGKNGLNLTHFKKKAIKDETLNNYDDKWVLR